MTSLERVESALRAVVAAEGTADYAKRAAAFERVYDRAVWERDRALASLRTVSLLQARVDRASLDRHRVLAAYRLARTAAAHASIAATWYESDSLDRAIARGRSLDDHLADCVLDSLQDRMPDWSDVTQETVDPDLDEYEIEIEDEPWLQASLIEVSDSDAQVTDSHRCEAAWRLLSGRPSAAAAARDGLTRYDCQLGSPDGCECDACRYWAEVEAAAIERDAQAAGPVEDGPAGEVADDGLKYDPAEGGDDVPF